MRIFKHKWKIVVAGTVLTGIFLIAATTHRTTQAAAPPSPRAVVNPIALVETMPIVPAEAAEAKRGSEMLHTTNRTDW
jgi:hypothetical protein